MRVDFVEENCRIHGVEPICAALPITPAMYYDHRARRLEPDRRSVQVKRDGKLTPQIRQVFKEDFEVHSAEKVRRQRGREGFGAAGYTVERLMQSMSLRGAVPD